MNDPSEVDSFATGDVLDSGAAGGMAIRGVALRASAYGASIILSLISVPFLTRHLGTTDYGYYGVATSLAFIFVGMTEAGLTGIGVREYTTLEADARERFLRNLIGLRLALTIAGIAMGGLFAAVTERPTIALGVTLIGIGTLLALTQQTVSIPLASQLRNAWIAGLELLKQVVFAGSTIALVIVGARLEFFYLTSVFAGIALLVATTLTVRRSARLLPLVDLAEWRRILRVVLPYAVAAAVGLVYFRVAQILLSFLSSGTEVGLYSVAFRIIEALAAIPTIVVTTVLPILSRAARDDVDRLGYALQSLLDVALLLGALAVLMALILAPIAVHVIGGPEFSAAIPVLRMQSLALATTFLVAVWIFGLIALRKNAALLVATSLATVVAIAATLLLAPSFGAVGAAAATVAAEATLAATLALALGRTDRRLMPSFVNLLRVTPAILAGGATALAVPIPAVPKAALTAVVYLGVAALFRAIPPELLRALLRRDAARPT